MTVISSASNFPDKSRPFTLYKYQLNLRSFQVITFRISCSEMLIYLKTN